MSVHIGFSPLGLDSSSLRSLGLGLPVPGDRAGREQGVGNNFRLSLIVGDFPSLCPLSAVPSPEGLPSSC